MPLPCTSGRLFCSHPLARLALRARFAALDRGLGLSGPACPFAPPKIALSLRSKTTRGPGASTFAFAKSGRSQRRADALSVRPRETSHNPRGRRVVEVAALVPRAFAQAPPGAAAVPSPAAPPIAPRGSLRRGRSALISPLPSANPRDRGTGALEAMDERT